MSKLKLNPIIGTILTFAVLFGAFLFVKSQYNPNTAKNLPTPVYTKVTNKKTVGAKKTLDLSCPVQPCFAGETKARKSKNDKLIIQNKPSKKPVKKSSNSKTTKKHKSPNWKDNVFTNN